MRMKKELILGMIASVVIVVLFGFRQTSNSKSDLTLENVEALSEDDTSLTDEERLRRNSCYSHNGYCDMASVCADGKVENVTCNITGELVIGGYTIIKGSYQKGKRYRIAWARYKCEASKGNYCTEQGIFVDGQKVT